MVFDGKAERGKIEGIVAPSPGWHFAWLSGWEIGMMGPMADFKGEF